ncbi:DegT/DnrJ/EryC1/StrS family aminotransferase [Leifsonia sp. L25]|uniref:DegT/DnrJ/EryC1/StrS family aminotransferase n=1 Tax=Actinomycetes TaxID=1760 RepID=UPI003D689778
MSLHAIHPGQARAHSHEAPDPASAGCWVSLRQGMLRFALQSALDAVGVGAGDQVIMPTYARRELAHAIAAAGFVVELADVDESLTLDAADLERRIRPQTRVVVVHHAAGAPADMSRLIRVARARGIVLIEDVSEALGVTFGGRDAGSFGDIAVRARGSNVEVASRLPGTSETLAALGQWQTPTSPSARECVEAATRRATRDAVLSQLGADAGRKVTWRPLWDPEGDCGVYLVALFDDASASRLAAERLTAEGVPASLVFSPEHGKEHVAYFWGSGEQSPWSCTRMTMDPGEFARSWAVLSRAVRIDVASALTCQDAGNLASRVRTALGSLP